MLKNELISYVKKERREGVKSIKFNAADGLYHIDLNDGWVSNDGYNSLIGGNIRRLAKSFHKVGEDVKEPVKMTKKVKAPKNVKKEPSLKEAKTKVNKVSKKDKAINALNDAINQVTKDAGNLEELEKALNEAHEVYKNTNTKSPEYKEARNKYLELAKQYEEAHKATLK